MAPQSFCEKRTMALRKVLAEKSQQDDDLDWEEWNNRSEFVVGKNWSAKKLIRCQEFTKLGTTCVVRPRGKIVAVERNERDVSVAAYVRIEILSAAGLQACCLENFGFCYPPTGNIKYVNLFVCHGALIRSETRFYTNPFEPRFIMDVAECQTLPEILSYKDNYFNLPEMRIFLALKAYPKSGKKQMVAVLFERLGNGGVSGGDAISFGEEALNPVTVAWLQGQGIPLRGVGHGGAACDQTGVYQLVISTAELLSGGPADAPAPPIPSVTLDLFRIKHEFLHGVTSRFKFS